MKIRTTTACFCLLLLSSAGAQAPLPAGGVPVVKQRVPYFVDPLVLRGVGLVKAPAATGSNAAKAELVEQHQVEQTRTAAEVAAAQFDDAHEDIFALGTVLGAEFTEAALPMTTAFSAHIRNDSGVMNAPLKERFKRLRPYNFDATLHPVCKTGAPTDYGYPSGHAMVGYLMALTLAQIVPEKSQELLGRAEEYARHRVVCGVHYASDVEASREVAYATFGYMMATARFEKELAAATTETRKHLGLGEVPVP